jgi:hyperosmotically inducible protein
MKIISNTFLSLSFVCLAGITACNNPNTAEDTGKKIDQAVENAETKMDEVTEKMEDARDEAGEEVEDAAITAKIKTALLAESTVKSLDINVNTVDRVVTLTGTADSLASSQKAAEIAAVVSEVKRVDNQLVIK